jgi:pimeloyl-ACP methyl ester carboxylesterase
MVAATDAESYAGCCEAIAEMDLHPMLPAIRAATVVLAGTLDPATPPRYLEAIATAIPASRLETLETAHLANWERADEVNGILAAHLEGSTDG